MHMWNNMQALWLLDVFLLCKIVNYQINPYFWRCQGCMSTLSKKWVSSVHYYGIVLFEYIILVSFMAECIKCSWCTIIISNLKDMVFQITRLFMHLLKSNQEKCYILVYRTWKLSKCLSQDYNLHFKWLNSYQVWSTYIHTYITSYP